MRRVLVIAPHPDDETLGAGGAINKFAVEGCEVSVLTVSGHLPPLYDRSDYERTVAEATKAFSILGVANYWFLEIPATMIGDQPVGVLNKAISKIIKTLEPNIVLCPFPDRHIDHRIVFESAMVACRPVGAGRSIEILAAYETLSETHWNAPNIEANFIPNWIVDISQHIEKKIDALACYESQIPQFPGARSLEAVKALAVFRGTQAGFAFGEAFQIIRKIS